MVSLTSATRTSVIRAYEDFLTHMERREALVAQQVAQQTIQQTGQFRNNINSKTLPADLANPHVLIAYLHMYALKGKGRMNADKVAHTNLRGSERTDRVRA